MKQEFCKKHPDTPLVVVKYCPACQGSTGGKKAAARMTAKQRTERARKAVMARYKKRRAK